MLLVRKRQDIKETTKVFLTYKPLPSLNQEVIAIYIFSQFPHMISSVKCNTRQILSAGFLK